MTQYAVTSSAWTAITSPGDSVSCWLDEDGDGSSGRVDVRVTHSTEGTPTDNPTECKRVWSPSGNSGTLTLNADNSRDVWYARCLNAGDAATVTVDHGVNHVHEMDVNVQSQLNPYFQYYLMRELKNDITLTAGVAKDSVVLPVSAGHGFVTPSDAHGHWVVLWENDRFVQVDVKSVSGDNVTISTPLPMAFTTAARVIRGDVNLAVDGSVTPVEYSLISYNSEIPVDISMASISMSHTAEGDDGKFGGIAALTNGFYYRRHGDIDQNLGNFRTNQAFREAGYVVEYPVKAPSGTYATSMVKHLIEAHTQELRIDPRRGDYLKGIVRDNLSGLTRFTVSLLGSYTKGE